MRNKLNRQPVLETYDSGYVALLKQAHACGKTMEEIAEEEGISLSSVSRLIGNRTVLQTPKKKKRKSSYSSGWTMVEV